MSKYEANDEKTRDVVEIIIIMINNSCVLRIEEKIY